MSTFISEPGTRLGGRYRLEDRTAAAGGWAAWKAIDEILARPVTVVTFEPGFPRVRETVTAARAAGRLTDARLTQVFDVEDDWDHAYIVMEWAAGDSLDDLLAAGPIDPGRGAQIVAEAAAALSVAHAAGLAHLCLQPGSLRWTPNSGVKIVGLGVDAALTGITSEDPAADDTRGLASLLYAALTGHWPGPDCPSLPPAPAADGRGRVGGGGGQSPQIAPAHCRINATMSWMVLSTSYSDSARALPDAPMACRFSGLSSRSSNTLVNCAISIATFAESVSVSCMTKGISASLRSFHHVSSRKPSTTSRTISL